MGNHECRVSEGKGSTTLEQRDEENAGKLDWTGIEFPTPFGQIERFEKRNPYDVHVFGYDEEDKVYPLRISKLENGERPVIVLLLVKNSETSHYCLDQGS